MLADRAARLEVRNRIEVETIGRGRDFVADEFRADAFAVLEQLAAEQDAVAARLDVEHRLASRRDGYAISEHDYQRSDRRNLRRRANAARYIAAQLRAYAADGARVDELVERARQEAWRDVAGQMQRKLRIYAAPPDSGEDPGRGDRLAALAAELAAHEAPATD